MSVMKTSGSKRERVHNGSYADERHLQKTKDYDDLPSHESIKTTQKFGNGKINYGLLVRFLRNQVGNDWDQVYSEIISRIPTKLLDYKEMVFWFVADNVDIIDGRPWNKKTQQFIWTGESFGPVHHTEIKQAPEFREFYVDPQTNKLVHIEQKAFKRICKRD
ncbi:hypothetical protein [Flavisolibacter tropicus]|uniref:Uncharacterized protein n=1 Tax=Flavisolibacter tropicus TaxID=1492898 RepID=A0A172U0X4_9BACT|nr:hypothetical protein [Flavisolibacter tropicus]ANE52906.1 hypothetical protein SY85_22920 [Flavisolibacter tropicus]